MANYTHERHGRGNKKTTMDDAFAVKTNHGSAWTCALCPFYCQRWCAIRAMSVLPTNKVCNYGWRKTRTVAEKRRRERRGE